MKETTTPRLEWELKEDTKDNKGTKYIIYAGGKNIDNMPEIKFSFELTRYKNTKTHRERLIIKCLLDGKGNGEAETTIDNLDKAFNELMQYGVVFSNDSERIKLKKKIVQIYLLIGIREEEDDESTKFEDFLTAAGEYIQLSEKDNTDDLCYIPVSLFDEIAGDCGYKSYELKELRKKLKDEGFLHTSSDRIAILVRYQNKPTRVIAFKREKMQDKKYVDSKYYAEVKAKREKETTGKQEKAQKEDKQQETPDTAK